jgi:hypothetical protein
MRPCAETPSHRLRRCCFGRAPCFFLDCGRGPFAVTADHIYSEYLEDYERSDINNVQIANVGGFNLRERVIARGENLGVDIATFQITPDEIAAGKRAVRGIDGP